uniref:Ion_trans_2 domain-containing protein n=1 Tax=Rhabditophanes sp. KR3021 TaxID=114890 RepID=A0AC35TVS6_9BILA
MARKQENCPLIEVSCEDDNVIPNKASLDKAPAIKSLLSSSSSSLLRRSPSSAVERTSYFNTLNSTRTNDFLKSDEEEGDSHIGIIKFRIQVYIVVIVLIVVAGAGTFYYLENDSSHKKQNEYTARCKAINSQILAHITEQFSLLFQNDANFNKSETPKLQIMIGDSIAKLNKCYQSSKLVPIKPVDFTNSIGFVYSVMSTTGTGDIFPTTSRGQIFVMIFGTISIPLYIAFYADLGELIMAKIIHLMYHVKNAYRKIDTRTYKCHVSEINCDAGVHDLTKLFISFGNVIAVNGICTWLNAVTNDSTKNEWNFLDAVSFVYESVAQIGLGYNAPEDSFKYVFIQLPFLVCGTTFFAIYVSINVNFIRHTLPILIGTKSSWKFHDSSQNFKADFLVKRARHKLSAITHDFHEDAYMRPAFEECMDHFC